MSRSYGAGGFSDQYDNSKMKSMDRDQHPGGVTGIHFEEEFDLDEMDFQPEHGEAYLQDRREPHRDYDLKYPSYSHSSGSSFKKGPKDWKLSDAKIKERVCEVLLHSHEVDPSEIEVEVEDAGVTLKGYISSKGMKNIAADLVESIPGVEDVFTQLKIRDTSNFQLSDKALNEARTTDLS